MPSTVADPGVTAFDLLSPGRVVNPTGFSGQLSQYKYALLTGLARTSFWPDEVFPVVGLRPLPPSMLTRPGFDTEPESFAYVEFVEFVDNDDVAW
jgi:hypothetical protein